jgi:hypothetical protein
MRSRITICALIILGGVALVMAQSVNTIEVQFYDEQGALLTGQKVVKISDRGLATQKLPGAVDGIYVVEAQVGEKIAFILDDPLHGVSRAEAVVPADLTGPLSITVPDNSGALAPPANDLCDDAVPVAVPSVTAGTTSEATIDSEQPFCGTSITSPGVWYEVAGTGNTMTATTCDGAGGSATYDTKISVYCKDCDDSTCVAGNDDSCSGGSSFLFSTVSWCSQLGATYRILVHGFGGQNGPFELNVTDNGSSCDADVQCLPEGACCSCLDPPFDCTITTEADCVVTGSTWQGADTRCLIPGGSVMSYVAFPNLAIPDSNSAGISHTITVPDSFNVGDINVDLGITHTWIGDLYIDVEHNGVTQRIWDRRCSSTDNIQATADDFGEETLCSAIGAGPIDSVFYAPEVAGLGPLSVFNDMDAFGDWTITVSDNAFLDTGTLDQWSLHIDEFPPVSICEGQNKVTLCHIPPGNPANFQTITVAESSVAAHLEQHGDFLGPCVSGAPLKDPVPEPDQPSAPTNSGTFGR